jgi:hypothetical protein
MKILDFAGNVITVISPLEFTTNSKLKNLSNLQSNIYIIQSISKTDEIESYQLKLEK